MKTAVAEFIPMTALVFLLLCSGHFSLVAKYSEADAESDRCLFGGYGQGFSTLTDSGARAEKNLSIESSNKCSIQQCVHIQIKPDPNPFFA